MSLRSARSADYAELECQLETGRTNQIRIHLAELRHPICGDVKYRGPFAEPPIADNSRAPRLALHAADLGFVHPPYRREAEILRAAAQGSAAVYRSSGKDAAVKVMRFTSPAGPGDAQDLCGSRHRQLTTGSRGSLHHARPSDGSRDRHSETSAACGQSPGNAALWHADHARSTGCSAALKPMSSVAPYVVPPLMPPPASQTLKPQ